MAAKKIYDILPPNIAHKVEDTLKSLGIEEPKKRATSKTRSRKKEAPRAALVKPTSKERKAKRFPLPELLVGGGVIAVLLGIYFYTKLPKAEILISPATETISLEEKISANRSAAGVDTEKKIIPAIYLEEQQEATKQFSATGSASNDGKATGTIKIYNKISPASPLTLKVGTHFLSDSGKYFVTLSRVVVPAMQRKTPGSISVKVQAEESGPSYNIGSSKFSVPKLSGTPYYLNIWADSSSAMTGGFTGKVKKVTRDDIEGAKSTLAATVLDQAEAVLRAQLSEDQVLLDGAISRDVVEATSSVKADTVAEAFNETVKVKISALVFKKSDLDAFVKGNIISQLPEGTNYIPESVSIAYTPDIIDIKGGVARVNVQISAQTYYEIDGAVVVELLSGKSASEINTIINDVYGDKVFEVRVNFWPFWVKKAPKDVDRIKVNLDLND